MFPKVYGNGVRDYSFTFEGTAWPRLDVRLSPTQPLITLESSVLTIKDPFTGGTTVVTMP
jgi:hypothetical protein